ncbi:NB-ARC domain-containing protein [Streptomyces sp. H39-C1]|uniref:NB-ARC domain-containing protein n=1 Tax=Streptomyces sp. H39-C1 TaxID=3004355 RepID=UPI0022AE5D05|nr:NB-ARC domain-containing protein [Streptomyces sp. H39-C1]MCZ4103663.1 NB-ARC domain-containing protein [Streptomyces sp. H39-C1]
MSAVVTAVVSAVTSLSENAATGQDRWPGPLDHIRQHAWVVLGAGLGVALLVALYALRHDAGSQRDIEDPPPPAPPEIPRWVVDRAQVGQVVAELCRQRGRRSVGITSTAGLHGAGGFGKTTLAEMVWADRRVQRRFRGRIYRITLGLDVRSRAEITAKVAEATRFITGDAAVFDDPDLAGTHLGRLLDVRPATLLLLDDVWTAEQLAPFLSGGASCRRLITTRLPELLPTGTHPVKVNEMSAAQARQVLTFGLPDGLPEATVVALLKATGRWPLLLRITNRYVHRRMTTGPTAADAAATILEQLRRDGPASLDPHVAVDLNDPRARQTAVAAAVDAGAALLPAGGFARFTELGIFAADESIPVGLIAALWHVTGSLSQEQSRDLCAALSGLSLLELDPTADGRVRLHDVIRDLLRSWLGDVHFREASCALIDAVAAGLPLAEPQPGGGTGPVHAWWQHPDRYLADHLITHLLDAERTQDAEVLALDLRWIEQRLVRNGVTGPLADLDQIPTTACRRGAVDLAQTAHLLAPIVPGHALEGVLRSRLAGYDTWVSQAGAWRSSHPALYNRWQLPDVPDPAQIRVLTGHTRMVTAVAIAPDGTWLAAGSEDGAVRIWDAATGQNTTTLTGHTRMVTAVAISPDGMWLATGSNDRTVRLWDVATGQNTATLTGPTGSVYAVAVSPDGTWLATGSNNRTVRIWDVTTGQNTTTLNVHNGIVNSVAISADGAWLATGSDDSTVRIWDAATGRNTTTLTGPTGSVYAVAVPRVGTWLATGNEDGTVRIWDAATGQSTTNQTVHTGSVYAVAISPDGTWLATGSNNRTVRIWNVATGQNTVTLTGHTRMVTAVAISSDGTWLATGSNDHSVRIWDVATGQNTITHAGHAYWVDSVAISSDGTWLAASSEDGTVRIWDAATGRNTATLTGHEGRVTAVAISPDGAWLASGSEDGTVRIWDAATGRNTATLTGHEGRVTAVAISPDGAWLASGSEDGTVRIWDAATGRNTITLTGHEGRVTAVAISPDGAWLASGSEDATVRIWDPLSGHSATAMRTEGKLRAMQWTPNNRGLAAVGELGLYLYDFDPGTHPTT